MQDREIGGDALERSLQRIGRQERSDLRRDPGHRQVLRVIDEDAVALPRAEAQCTLHQRPARILAQDQDQRRPALDDLERAVEELGGIDGIGVKPEHLHQDAHAEDIGVGEARSRGEEIDVAVVAQRQRRVDPPPIGGGGGIGDRLRQGPQRRQQRPGMRPAITSREQPTDQRLRDHRHAEEGFGRLADQEAMLDRRRERRGGRLRDTDRDAVAATEKLSRGDRLRRGAGFRAEDHERARVETRRILSEELRREMTPHLQRRAEMLDPVLQPAHRAVWRSAGEKDHAIDARPDLPAERHGALQRRDGRREFGDELGAIEDGRDEAAPRGRRHDAILQERRRGEDSRRPRHAGSGAFSAAGARIRREWTRRRRRSRRARPARAAATGPACRGRSCSSRAPTSRVATA